MSEGKYSVGILVVSDSCSLDASLDQSGRNLKTIIEKSEDKLLKVIEYSIVPDDRQKIEEIFKKWSDELKLNLILASGGTGISPTDVTPEATKNVIDREMNCLTTAILVESLKITKFAMLSRAVAGVRKKTLIINLPGSKKASQEAFLIVQPVLKHTLDLINEVEKEVKKEHVEIQSGLRDEATVCQTSAHKHCHEHAHEHRHEARSKVSEHDVISKPRKSTFPMISVDDALAVILKNAYPLDIEELFYMNALGRVSAGAVRARDPLPPFAASIKDGFAVRLNQEQRSYLQTPIEEKNPFEFDVVGASNAGDALINMELDEGQCVKINTGAPVPLKADAVVQIEDTVPLVKNEKGVDVRIKVVCGGGGCGSSNNPSSGFVNIKIGQEIRPIGFDIQSDEVVVKERSVIKAAQVGICATVGALKLRVFSLPSVSLVSTGNELASPDQEVLKQGQIRDSNKSLLFAALKQFGIEKIHDAGVATDDPHCTLKVFRKAMETSDVIVSTGGVSMGDKDLVKDVLVKDLNCVIHFARLNMKPGKPTTFATCDFNGKRKFFFCLPGNPVSAIVTFNLVVVPCLKQLMGYSNPFSTEIQVKCEFDADLDERPEFHRCWVEWPKNSESAYPNAFSTGNQHSSRLLSMNDANCLVKLPGRKPEKTSIRKGEILNALIIEKI